MDHLYDKIESYLLGELTGNTLKDFEQALQSDAALARSVAQHRDLLQRLDAMRLRKKVKLALTSPGAGDQKRAAIFPPFVYWSVAASLALMLVAVWFFFREPVEIPMQVVDKQSGASQSDTSPVLEKESNGLQPEVQQHEKPPKNREPLLALVREYYAEPAPDFIRDATDPKKAPKDNNSKPIDADTEFYGQKDDRQIAELLSADKAVEGNETARFLRANARFHLGQYAGAATDFEALKNSFQFKQEARWNFLICRLALGNMEFVKAQLSEMGSDPDFPFRASALELKRKLNF